MTWAFISVEGHDKVWLAFKYENLPKFCFSCGRLGHEIKDCEMIPLADHMKEEDELPYSNALKAESVIRGKECLISYP